MSFDRHYDGANLRIIQISGIEVNCFLAMMNRIAEGYTEEFYQKLAADFPVMWPVLRKMLDEFNDR